MKSSILKLTSLLTLIVVIGGILALALPTGTVAASAIQEDTPPNSENGNGWGPRKAILEKAFKRENDLLAHLDGDLGRIPTVVEKTNSLIAKAQAKGLDTSKVEAALAAYKSSAAAIAPLRDEAAAVLETHAGFDDKGKVTDLKIAADTVRTAGAKLREAHRAYHDAGRELRQAVREFIEANRSTLGPAEAPEM